MTHHRAVRVANLMMGVAAAGAAYYILRTPSLRRMAWGIATTAVVSTLPAWFSRELRQAWVESVPAADASRDRDMMTA